MQHSERLPSRPILLHRTRDLEVSAPDQNGFHSLHYLLIGVEDDPAFLLQDKAMSNRHCSKEKKGKVEEQGFRVNCVSPCINVQTLYMYVELICSFELPFVAKAIMGRIRREGL